jgi:bifunctional DNase/RNase
MVPVDVLGVQLSGDTATPVVLLREIAEPHRIVPVVVGGNEALAIAFGLQGVETPRPLTHDLFVDVLAQTSTTVGGVTITEVRDGAFVAELVLDGPQGARVLDSRPSDAIAIAVRVHAPLFIAADVLDAAGMLPAAEDDTFEELIEAILDGDPDDAMDEPVDDATADALVDEFRSFLDDVDPSDFAG